MQTLLQASSPNANRIVAVCTPLVFAPLAGAIAAGVAKYGVDIDDDQVQAIFIAGATIALAKSAQWTKGWQAFEQRQDTAAADPLAIGGEDDLDDMPAGPDAEPDDDIGDDFDDDMHDDLDDEVAELLAGHGS